MIKKLFTRENVLYVICGIGTMLINYAVFYLAKCLLGNELATLCGAISFIAATTFAFFANKVFVFQSKSFSRPILLRELSMFVTARLFSFGVEELGLFIAANLLHAERFSLVSVDGVMIAKVLLSVISTVLNYIFSKFLIFRKKRSEDTSEEKGEAQ